MARKTKRPEYVTIDIAEMEALGRHPDLHAAHFRLYVALSAFAYGQKTWVSCGWAKVKSVLGVEVTNRTLQRQAKDLCKAGFLSRQGKDDPNRAKFELTFKKQLLQKEWDKQNKEDKADSTDAGHSMSQGTTHNVGSKRHSMSGGATSYVGTKRHSMSHNNTKVNTKVNTESEYYSKENEEDTYSEFMKLLKWDAEGVTAEQVRAQAMENLTEEDIEVLEFDWSLLQKGLKMRVFSASMRANEDTQKKILTMLMKVEPDLFK